MIPDEMKAFPSWVAWRPELRDGKWTKVPYNPTWGTRADTADPSTWGTFDQAIAFAHANQCGAGFVFSDLSPYSGVDLDDPFKRKNDTYITTDDFEEYAAAQAVVASHRNIITDFASYSEWSPSGRGVHTIIRGKLPPNSRNRAGKVEVYSTGRFFTMTGNVTGLPHLPIADRQALLELLSAKLGTATGGGNYVSQPERITDQEVLNLCASGANAELFLRLWAGDQTGYESGSQADLALANVLCFYTENFEQAERLFRHSPHYHARTKLHGSHGDYLIKRAINLGFDQKPPPVDFSALKLKANELRETFEMEPEREDEQPDAWLIQERPDGLLGDVADYIYQSAPRQVKEIALCGAIGLLAGLCGKAFNISNTGLNHYVVLIADSGVGKEAMASGINRLIEAMATRIPAVRQFLGPSYIASAAAMYKSLGDDSPSFVSILSEIGIWLKTHTDERAQPHQSMLVRAFLDLWMKSGRADVLQGMAYANRDNNVVAVSAPAFSFVGESVPDKFFGAVTEQSISQGLIPRFMMMTYNGHRAPLNVHHATVKPSVDLIDKLCFLADHCLRQINTSQVTDVMIDDEAAMLFAELERFCTSKHNEKGSTEVDKAMWNRAHLKAMRLAALRAVGRNWIKPLITLADAQWARAFAIADVRLILERFATGEISSSNIDVDRSNFILSTIKRYFMSPHVVDTYHLSKELYHAHFIPYTFIQKTCVSHKLFKPHVTHRKHGSDAIKEVIADLVLQGVLQEASPASVAGLTGGSNQKAYVVLDHKAIERAVLRAGNRGKSRNPENHIEAKPK